MSGTEKTNGSLALTPRIITIPAKEPEKTRKLRVAAYTRVSSNSRDQLHSFVVQNAHYSKLITDNPEWELVDVYADKGITGTSVEKRDDFLRMMEDCRRGRIDRILVKSSTRFARNTRESLEAVRELAAMGVSVYFEEQNIDTAKTDGEVLTALYAAMAQRGSEAISSRMHWSYHTRIFDGGFSTCKAPYGYRLVDGRLEIREDEAAVIRLIFQRYLEGCGMSRIAEEITKLGCQTRDHTPYWQYSTIQYILQNEKYMGDSLAQKTYTTRSLPFQQRDNKGKLTQVLRKDVHPAIVSREEFSRVQELIRLRNAKRCVEPKEKETFAGKIVCGKCGSQFKRKKCRGSVYWVCRRHDEAAAKCAVRQIEEQTLEEVILCLYYNLKHYGPEILAQLITDLHSIKGGSLLWSEGIVEINKQISDIACQERLLTQLKQQGVVDPDIFISRADLLAERRRELKRKKERIIQAEEDDTIQRTEQMLDTLESGPDWLETFDEAIFNELVEKIVVLDNETLHFRLLNGLEIPEKIERTRR